MKVGKIILGIILMSGIAKADGAFVGSFGGIRLGMGLAMDNYSRAYYPLSFGAELYELAMGYKILFGFKLLSLDAAGNFSKGFKAMSGMCPAFSVGLLDFPNLYQFYVGYSLASDSTYGGYCYELAYRRVLNNPYVWYKSNQKF